MTRQYIVLFRNSYLSDGAKWQRWREWNGRYQAVRYFNSYAEACELIENCIAEDEQFKDDEDKIKREAYAYDYMIKVVKEGDLV